MKKVGCREFKNRQGHYLARVREGETIILTDRGKPVAQLAPVPRSASMSLDKWLDELESQGHLRRAKGGKLSPFDPVPAKGKPASQIIIEDRD